MEIVPISKESHSQLRNLFDTFLKNYRSLESMGEHVKEWHTILIYILVAKLDHTSKREWEIYCKDIVSPTIDDFNKFLSQRCHILETLNVKSLVSNRTRESKTFVAISNAHASAQHGAQVYTPRCPYCKEAHFIYFCDKFKQLSISDRFSQANKMRLCTNCLRYGHQRQECRSSGCKICKSKHATLLHRSNTTVKSSSTNLASESPDSNENTELENTSVVANTCQNIKKSFILLSTAIVNVLSKNRKPIPCKVLLDSGSQSNFVTTNFLNKLDIEPTKVNVPVMGINQIKTDISERVEIEILSRQTSYRTKLTCLVLSSISGLTPQTNFDSSALKIPLEFSMADPDFNIPSEIDMLIGCEIFFDLICSEQVRLGKNLPVLQKTLLGWVIAGPIPFHNIKSDCHISQCFLSESLEKFWKIEEINPLPQASLTKEEIECENHFTRHTTRDRSGKFVVKLPLKENFKNLGSSEETALNRLYGIERRLSKNPNLEKLYKEFMLEYQSLGHMTKIRLSLEYSYLLYPTSSR
ncbi:uncharacterized protein LOC126749753 [Anthonomus grandis grandis]|uniref:uncharacterized protein LOC126749753 n=1 Tax=Anthonomus grandis grandis TaxID=2921223 RepID=UPI002165689C|nr:uncharacterized protein LOC126749753 [Anthonomus grandis grandis]